MLVCLRKPGICVNLKIYHKCQGISTMNLLNTSSEVNSEMLINWLHLDIHVLLLMLQRLDSKLTDQQKKLEEGKVPMPMYSCLHVKKHVSAMVFHGRFNQLYLKHA